MAPDDSPPPKGPVAWYSPPPTPAPVYDSPPPKESELAQPPPVYSPPPPVYSPPPPAAQGTGRVVVSYTFPAACGDIDLTKFEVDVESAVEDGMAAAEMPLDNLDATASCANPARRRLLGMQLLTTNSGPSSTTAVTFDYGWVTADTMRDYGDKIFQLATNAATLLELEGAFENKDTADDIVAKGTFVKSTPVFTVATPPAAAPTAASPPPPPPPVYSPPPPVYSPPPPEKVPSPPPPPTYAPGSDPGYGGYGDTETSTRRRLIQVPEEQLQDTSGSVAIVYNLPVACADLRTDSVGQAVQGLVEDELWELESVEAWASPCVSLQGRASTRRLQGAPLSRTIVQLTFSGAIGEELEQYVEAVARVATSDNAKALVVRSVASSHTAGTEVLQPTRVQAQVLLQ